MCKALEARGTIITVEESNVHSGQILEHKVMGVELKGRESLMGRPGGDLGGPQCRG